MKARQIQESKSFEKSRQRVTSFKSLMRKQLILDLFTRCGVCGTKLHFHSHASKDAQWIEEDVFCPKCDQRAPKRRYRIQ